MTFVNFSHIVLTVRHHFLSILVLIFYLSVTLASCQKESDISFDAMNTFMTIRSFGLKGEKANERVRARIAQIEETISTTKEESEIYRLNHTAGTVQEISQDTELLLDFSLRMAQKTGGALNPCLYPITSLWGFTTENFRVPSDSEISAILPYTDFSKISMKANHILLEKNMMIDLGAVGKGFASDEAVKILKKAGITSAIIDLGGNIYALGKKRGKHGKKSDWLIGVKDPFSGDAALAVSVHDKAIITSGGYERFFEDENGKRYIHIFDGKTGKPAESDIASVTIVADSGLYADALSTSLFVMGKKNAIDFWRAHRDFEAIIILDEKSIAISSGLADSFKLIAPFQNVEIFGIESR